jgi:exosortase family protein XrtF
LNKILQSYKPTIYFIIKFISIYLVLVLIYNYYLSFYQGTTDPLTLLIGKWVTQIYHWLGLQVSTIPLEHESGLKLIINNNYVARIVEGCTAASVIIMFAAFVLSFTNNIKQSLKFVIFGSLSIFIFNILRIVFLGYLLYAYPQYQDVAHRIIFPALIYGYVVFLWLLFIKKYDV